MRQSYIAVFHDHLVDDMDIAIGAFQVRPNDSSLEIFPLNDRIIAVFVHQINKLESRAASEHVHAAIFMGQLDQILDIKGYSDL